MQDAQKYETDDVALQGSQDGAEGAVRLAHRGTRYGLVGHAAHEDEQQEGDDEAEADADQPDGEPAQFEVRGDGFGEQPLGDIGTKDAAGPGTEPKDALEKPFPEAQ